jgi:putative ATPase
MQQFSLINKTKQVPLAELMRPKNLKDVYGQQHLIEGPIGRMLESNHLHSFILWGPPGCGKTTIAKIIANSSKMRFVMISAVTSGVAELKEIFAKAKLEQTLLLVDEIHRFNRTQQDSFLPYIEDGTIILIGATTENPSFELNSALLSRCKVVVLNQLDKVALNQLINRAESFKGKKLPLTIAARDALINMADGDGRYLLGLCEELFNHDKQLDIDELPKFLQKRSPIYDKSGDSHYNLISALHKSLRGSDVDASLYWLARMLVGGEDPIYILRRLIRFTSEDIGMADPQSLQIAISARDSYEFLGSPEGDLAISGLVIYLATAPKSNACYQAHKMAFKDAKNTGSLTPPKNILNAPTKLMRDQDYGKDYIYDHDTELGFSGQNYFPEKMDRKEYYHPKERGFEREIAKRIAYFNNLRNK